METKSRVTAALTAVLLCLPVLTLPAYIQSTEPKGKPSTQGGTTTTKPLTLEGIRTMVDNATSEDGKGFYTIQTPDEHILFLVIDKQCTNENVYFLDAVTGKDLPFLARTEKELETVEPEPELASALKEPADELEPEPASKSAREDSLVGTIPLVSVVAVIGGGTDWYFKIYCPKHQAPDLDEEEIDFEAEDDEPAEDDDSPSWDEGEPGKEDEE